MTNSTLTAIEVERNNRLEKAKLLQSKGNNPYTEQVKRDLTLQALSQKFDSLKGKTVTVAGYIKSLRLSGKIGFTTVEDDSLPEGFQFIFKSDLLAEAKLNFEDFKELVDRGDYIQVTGSLDLSQRGEPSVFVVSYTVLTKSLRSLPEKLDDIELKYRKRYVDMKLHPEVREIFRMKSKFWQATREYMLQNDFLEVQAPTLEHTTGGAEAKPFSTHHNALDEDFYLRISSELFLKRYIAGGFEKVFDIDKNYRNEGIDDEHLQEYIALEFYWAYSEFEQMLEFSEDLIKYVISNTFNTLEFKYQDKVIDWSIKWPRLSYYEFIEKFAGISLQEYDTVEKLKSLADRLNLKYNKTDGYGRMLDLIYKKTARPKCIEPVWLIDHPVAISPLAKRNPNKPEYTLRSQLIAYGSELTNGYAELNDPVDQLARFEEQQSLRDQGDDEAMMIDTDFVEALEYGIPPTCGFNYSERLFSILMQKPMRETTAFPLMKRENKNDNKNRTLKVAHSIILKSPSIPEWQILNTASHLSSSFSARKGKSLFEIESSFSKDEIPIIMNIQYAIINKYTDNNDKLRELYKYCLNNDIDVTIFTESMLNSSNDKKVHNDHINTNFNDINILGILLFGDKYIIENLTKEFTLWNK